MTYKKPKHIYKTPDLEKALGVTRMTIYTWEKRGIFTPPRNLRGDRVFTKGQFQQIVKAFSPGGNFNWHPAITKTTQDKLLEDLTNRVLILEKMVAHILYTRPCDDDDDEEYTNPYPNPDKPFEFDGMIDDAWKIASDTGKVSTSYLQRRMCIGYNLSAKIMDELEKQGIISKADGVKPREMLKQYPDNNKEK